MKYSQPWDYREPQNREEAVALMFFSPCSWMLIPKKETSILAPIHCPRIFFMLDTFCIFKLIFYYLINLFVFCYNLSFLFTICCKYKQGPQKLSSLKSPKFQTPHQYRSFHSCNHHKWLHQVAKPLTSKSIQKKTTEIWTKQLIIGSQIGIFQRRCISL